jgi:hypothetical protein
MAEMGVSRKHCMILLTIPKMIQAPATIEKKNLLFAVKSVTDKVSSIIDKFKKNKSGSCHRK